MREQGDGGAQVHRVWGHATGASGQDAALRAVSTRIPPRLHHSAADQGAAGQVVLPLLCIEGATAQETGAQEQGPVTATVTATDAGHTEPTDDNGHASAMPHTADAQVNEPELNVS